MRAAHVQLVTDGKMYDNFKESSDEPMVEATTLSMFASYRPWNVESPHKRSCVCAYHTAMGNMVEDAKAAHLLLHAACGTPRGCSCSYCVDGACLKDDVFADYHSLGRSRVCVGDKPSCVSGLCDNCGIMEAREVRCVKSPRGVGVTVDADMYVTKVERGSDAERAGVQVGWRVVAARADDGPNQTEMRLVSCKGDLEWQTGRHYHGDRQQEPRNTTATVRFQTAVAKPPWACCPLLREGDTEISHRVATEVEQAKAHASITRDGDEIVSKTIKVLKVTSLAAREFLKKLVRTNDSFLIHNFIAHRQAESFDRCIDNLPWGHVVYLLDFSMNWGHEHGEEAQQEWWTSWQTTLLPAVAYRRVRRFDGDTEGVVVAESRVFVSADLNHSNAMVQWIIAKLIAQDKETFEKAGFPLKSVHLWSDGCAGQFKTKTQFYFLTLGPNYGVKMDHHFFQSCHGKGPSDSEGAVVKCALRRQELMKNYMAQTSDVLEWLQANLTKDLGYV